MLPIVDYRLPVLSCAMVVLLSASPGPAYSGEGTSRPQLVPAAPGLASVGASDGEASGAAPLLERGQLLRMLAGAMEAESMARYAAGSYWQVMSEPEQARYTTLFARHLMALIADLLPKESAGFAAQPWTMEQRGGSMLMSTSISVNDTPVSIAVLLRGTSPPRIVDVLLDSVSLAEIQREGITSVAGRYGIGVLLAELEQRSKTGEMNQWRVLAQNHP